MMFSALNAIEVNAPFEIGNDPLTLLSMDGTNHIFNSSFQFSDCCWPVFVYFCFQEPPQMKIQGFQVWRMRCPVRGTASADDPVLKWFFNHVKVTFAQCGVAPSCCSHRIPFTKIESTISNKTRLYS